MAGVGYSLRELETERAELRKDLYAFMTAYDVVRRRVIESSEDHPARAEILQKWSGNWACIGSLDLATKAIETKILEIGELIEKVLSGEIDNTDKKRNLEVVKEDRIK